MLARSNSKRKEKEGDKTTLKGISKDLDRKCETNIDSVSSDSSSSEKTLSKSNPKVKHPLGSQKNNAEKGQARKLQSAKKGQKEALESDSSSSDSSSSEESLSEHPSEKRGNSINFKVVCMKKKTFTRGIVKNGDNKGARVGVTNGETAEQSTVLQGSKNNGTGVVEEDSSSSDSCENEQSVNAATMASGLQNRQPLSSSSMSIASPSISNRDAKADSIHNKRSQDKKKKDDKSKNMSSSFTALLPSTRTLSSSSLPQPKATQDTRTPTTQTSTRLLSKSVGGIASPLASSSNSAKQGNSQPRTSIQRNQKLGSSLGNLSSSHIRFDSDDDDAEDQQGDTALSNITDSFSEANSNTATKGGQVKSVDQTISCKDMEVKETTQRDYTSCIPLCGPPRAGDKIAYKVLELSASYTPELSNYKHGTVISYEASTGDVTMDLTKESLVKTQGDGNVSRKFELVYEEDGEDQSKEENEKLETLVVVPWSTIVEAVFVED
ncbi:PREDICTED: coilin-like [Acropora digitifera]|uniref:coilin-like n=1 Tax=Acropora digitifera TaxID=70779 RepID=UPI00077AA140|nr:PREDICTED: coilin-like [Acropora digitifera]